MSAPDGLRSSASAPEASGDARKAASTELGASVQGNGLSSSADSRSGDPSMRGDGDGVRHRPSVAVLAENAHLAARAGSRRLHSILMEIFPWRKLHENVAPSPYRWFHKLSPFAILLIGISIWVVSLLFFCYMFLTIGTMTHLEPIGPFYKDGTDEVLRRPWEIQAKMPLMGQHYPFFVIGKHIIEVILLHHLCRNLMQPINLEEERTSHLDKAVPNGVLHAVRWLFNKACGREHKKRWLSSFTVDHILLFLVGICGILHQFDMVVSNLQLSGKLLLYPAGLEPPTWTVVIHMVIACYVSILMMGFLFTTLEYNVAPAAGKQNEFRLMVTLSLVLWLLDFVIIVLNRNLFMAYWSESNALERIIASLAQIFVTHGSVMLGAVMFGHSSHFHKSPDMTWSTFIWKFVPVGFLTGLYYSYYSWSRLVHTWQNVHPTQYAFIALPQPYLNVLWRVLGGGFLIYMAYRNRGGSFSVQRAEQLHHCEQTASHFTNSIQSLSGASRQHQRQVSPKPEEHSHPQGRQEEEEEEDDGEEMVVSLFDMLDYDAALILFTGSFALLYNINMIYDLKPDGVAVLDVWPFLGQIGGLLAPIGLVVFTLGAWRRPPHRHGDCMAYHGLWFALFFCMTQFFIFQVAEDCEISSDLKTCCAYPSFPGRDHEEHFNTMCNKGRRCLSKANPSPDPESEWEVGDFYCSIAHSHHDVDDTTAKQAQDKQAQEKQLAGLREEVAGMHAQWQMFCAELASSGASPDLTAQCLLKMRNASAEEHTLHRTERRLQDITEGSDDCCCCKKYRQTVEYSCSPGTWVGATESGCPTEPGQKLDERCRQELSCRWRVFNLIGGSHDEVEEHEEKRSTPFVLFETWGTAASVEMYFTICGVLLKVILLTQHPRSNEILELDAHHHHVDHKTGEHQVVTVRPGSMVGTVRRSRTSSHVA